MLCTCIDVCHGFLFGCVESGALQNYVDIKLFPRKICSVLLGIDGDLLAVYDDCVVCCFYGSVVTAMCCVIFQKVCEHLRACKIVDRNYLISLCLEHLTECKTANTSKTINRNSYCHNLISS